MNRRTPCLGFLAAASLWIGATASSNDPPTFAGRATPSVITDDPHVHRAPTMTSDFDADAEKAAEVVAPRPANPASDWWAYQPLVRPPVPGVAAVEGRSWVVNPIDNFILARLEATGLIPARQADRLTLIRRATFDLTGLPPTPAEVEAFLADESPDAYAQLIERLLASPQYGVKWGRHWLDLVRYAETDSFERDRPKPMAWKYRDYVINAFNGDKPYDRFLIEQLAGDEIEDASVESLIATGYYRLGIWDDEPTDVLQAQYDDLDGILSTTSQVVLGMTVGCARCHDHKKDPIPQRDYYRLLAFFENVKPYNEDAGNSINPENFVRSVPVDMGDGAFEHMLADHARTRERLSSRLEEIRRSTLNAESGSKAADSTLGDGLAAHLTFDEATDGAFLASVEAMKGEFRGGSSIGGGRFGAARSFAGRNDFIRLPRPVADDFTLSLWFRTTETGPGGSDYRWFLGAGLIDGEVRGIVRDFGMSYHSDGRITAGVGAPETFVHSPPGYNDGQWHHAAFTRERSTGIIRLFVDGEQVADAAGCTDPLDAPESITIGRMQPGYNSFEGDIDDVRIYSRALDPREALALSYGDAVTPGFGDRILAALGAEEHRRYEQLIAELSSLRTPVREMTEVLCVTERGPTPPDSFIRVRGNAGVKGDPVDPGVPSVLESIAPAPSTAANSAGDTTGRRLALARWLTDPSNPMTARVMANRLWQHHFGRGLVRTTNDFGRLGELPTHPELLDWLATEFIARDWSIKDMHRLIMSSSAYRMSSGGHERGLEIDPTNELFWRFDMRRLTAEELRDSILAATGTLNLEMGGPSIYPPMPREVLATSSRPDQAWGESTPEDAARRSVYIHVKRSLLTPLLVSFDMADTDNSCDVRFATTQPTQALTLLNSEFMQEQAALFASRLDREVGDDNESQIRRAFRLTTSREPSPDEVAECFDLILELETTDGLPRNQAMTYFCLMMLNLNEFVYLD